MRIKPFLVCLALFVLALVVSGCGDSGADDSLDAASQAITNKDRAAALKHVNDAISEDPKDPVIRYKVVMIFTRPEYHKEQVQAAKDLLELFESGAQWPPQEFMLEKEVYSSTAMLMDNGGEYDLAQKFYEMASEKYPKDPAIANNLAYFYAERQIKLDEAEKLARYADRRNPGQAFITDTLGWVLYRKGKYAEAAKYMNDSLKKEPNSEESRYHLAVIYASMGKKAEAKIELNKALTLNPNYEDAKILSDVLSKSNK